MSSVYNLEPVPTAKATLHTTSGDISLELWGAQAPLATRSFLQHCLDGYYDNTIFHRLIPGFILQGGDPTGTGHGGESALDGGRPFADEFHSRLRYNRRGLLGMANTGEKDDNGSQFFLTLGETKELQGKNTLFGRVVGDTVYNVVRMGEAELEEDGSERPMFPVKITGATVIVNPFEDIVKRIRVAERIVEQPKKKDKSKKKGKAGKTLISFGIDDEEDASGPAISLKPKTAFNPKVANTLPEPAAQRPPKRPAERLPDRPAKRRASPPSPAKAPDSRSGSPSTPSSASSSRSATPDRPAQPSRADALSAAQAQIAALKTSLRRDAPAPAPEKAKRVSRLEAMIPTTAMRGRKRPGDGGKRAGTTADEERAIREVEAFRRKIGAVSQLEAAEDEKLKKKKLKKEKEAEDKEADTEMNGSRATGVNAPAPDDDDEEAALCDLHFIANCESCRQWDNPDEEGGEGGGPDEADEDLFSHRLTFEKDRLGKDLEWKRRNEEELVVIDPLVKGRELKEEKIRERAKGRDKDKDRWKKAQGAKARG